MCAVGRALMSRPKMILLDEPSMGLAPQIVEEIFEIVKHLIEREQVSFLLAEQNTSMALRYARYGYILENGRVVMDGDAKSLSENEDVKEIRPRHLRRGRRKSFHDGNIIAAGSGGWRNPDGRSLATLLETRDSAARERELFAALPGIIVAAR